MNAVGSAQAVSSSANRKFGLTVGGGFLVIALVAVWRGRLGVAQITGGLGGALAIAALIVPAALEIPNRGWQRIAHMLGWINTRVLLGAVFVVILAPIGLLWRITGKDPMARNRQRWPGWTPRPLRYRDRLHFTKRY